MRGEFCLTSIVFCFFKNIQLFQVESKVPRRTPVKVLLPHEILHTIATCSSPAVFDSVMLGCLPDEARVQFWTHIRSLEAWRTHPIWEQDLSLEKLIGVTIHGDGAVMKRDDEAFVYSMSSCFSHFGNLKDILMIKYPIAIIPERHMRSKTVLCLINSKSQVTFWYFEKSRNVWNQKSHRFS